MFRIKYDFNWICFNFCSREFFFAQIVMTLYKILFFCAKSFFIIFYFRFIFWEQISSYMIMRWWIGFFTNFITILMNFTFFRQKNNNFLRGHNVCRCHVWIRNSRELTYLLEIPWFWSCHFLSSTFWIYYINLTSFQTYYIYNLNAFLKEVTICMT